MDIEQFLEIGRQGAVLDHLLNLAAGLVEVVEIVGIEHLQAPVDLGDMGGGEKMPGGRGRHHKPRRHGQTGKGGDLAEIGHLLARLIFFPPVDLGQGQDEGPLPQERFAFDDLVEIMTDPLENRLQIPVSAVGHRQQVADHLIDVDQHGGDL